MKRSIILAFIFTLIVVNPAFAGTSKYSPETERLMREAGLQVDELEWEEIDRRQQEYRKRRQTVMCWGILQQQM